jgi:hypothetical protein
MQVIPTMTKRKVRKIKQYQKLSFCYYCAFFMYTHVNEKTLIGYEM